MKPVERAVEARGETPIAGAAEPLNSLVRCLYFAKTYVLSSKFPSSNEFLF